ncbi:MAG: hypothetical protein M1834_009067 [Cirrosporium novae-zelandiae]|nr:MAG: hypothetical protein M1834_009067 [Cirrosporium novae-zelandiae]
MDHQSHGSPTREEADAQNAAESVETAHTSVQDRSLDNDPVVASNHSNFLPLLDIPIKNGTQGDLINTLRSPLESEDTLLESEMQSLAPALSTPAPVNLFNIPPEIFDMITSFLAFPARTALMQASRGLYAELSPKRPNPTRGEMLRYLQFQDRKLEDMPSLPCYACLRLLPREAFIEEMRECIIGRICTGCIENGLCCHYRDEFADIRFYFPERGILCFVQPARGPPRVRAAIEQIFKAGYSYSGCDDDRWRICPKCRRAIAEMDRRDGSSIQLPEDQGAMLD